MDTAVALRVPATRVAAVRAGRAVAFGRHLIEMLVAMLVGMSVLGIADGLVLGAAGLGDVRSERPLFDLLLMAIEMTLPMAAWMAFRGHARRDTIEMANAMLLPAVVLATIGLAGLSAAMDAEMAFHPLMLVAMVALMLFRADVYAAPHTAHGGSHGNHAGGVTASDATDGPRSTQSPDPATHARAGSPFEATPVTGASPEEHVVPAPAVPTPLRPSLARFAAVAALAGLVIEVVAAVAHPSHVQPNDSPNVFIEYAASPVWVQVHLAQFLGSLLVGAAIVLVAFSMRSDRSGAAAFAFVAALAGVLSLAVFAVQMAVDGVALKAAFDAWVAATDPVQKAAAFGVAEVVRSLEKGLDGIFTILNGVSLAAVGVAILLGRRYSVVLGVLGAVAGVALTISGWLTATTGFSPEAGTVAGPAEIALILFLVGAAISLTRTSFGARRSRSASLVAAPAGA
jgi:hypothetical protein